MFSLLDCKYNKIIYKIKEKATFFKKISLFSLFFILLYSKTGVVLFLFEIFSCGGFYLR